jgi:RNA polymerase sigma factor (sigma-70 family)
MGEVEEEAPAGRGAEPSDVELVRAYRDGDVHAFEELHRRYVASIYRLVRRKLGDALLAEDIAQETFMKALRMMDRVDDSFNFGGWVHTVARNLCYDELRRRQRDLRADGTTEEEDDELMSTCLRRRGLSTRSSSRSRTRRAARSGRSRSACRRSTGSSSPCASCRT